jgi:TusA-related sulfurtransferase
MAENCKKNELTIKQNLKKVENGESATVLAKDYRVGIE